MILLADARLPDRRDAARGSLAPLAASLAADLAPIRKSGVNVPHRKARMTRAGGRCLVDGTLLEFDPFSPSSHRCARCGAVYTEPVHHDWWLMSYHLWLAERAVHDALLLLLTGESGGGRIARDVLHGYSATYLSFPNRDNVLGPSRPFFSTYLESIWLLQLCVAADLLAATGDREPLDRFLERVALPSAALIASYPEGESNRQVWNDVAMLAVARLSFNRASTERLLLGPRSIATHLRDGLLADGSWYEGENYHQFAHRGLWYGVTMADVAGISLPPTLVARFDEGFASPFLTALPDLTFPSRRDSPWRVSLRQWRHAESCELGLARRDDPRLRSTLARLYEPDVPEADTGRARSAAESERNVPAARLSRADLGWRSLLHARAELPPLMAEAPRSVLMEGQGLAVFRRDHARTYVALDYGHSGGGHGHPDRLNLMLVDGATRWLDDPGTGSYVDATLHWYRSTLAHCAPLANGRSQWREDGALLAWEERGGAGWVEARAQLADGIEATRTVIVMPGYVLDVLRWRGKGDTVIDLPIHADGEVQGARWISAPLVGSDGLEDGFRFVQSTERLTWPRDGHLRIEVRRAEARATLWVASRDVRELWRAVAPGPPGEGLRRFHVVRSAVNEGAVAQLWDLRGEVKSVAREGEAIVVATEGGRHTHHRAAHGWHVDLTVGDARSTLDLGGVRERPTPRRIRTPGMPRAAAVAIPRLRTAAATAREELPLRFELGGMNYRRSELSWADAGKPTASISFWVRESVLAVHVDVRKADVTFAAEEVRDVLDNELPLIHGDGIQLHLILPARGAPLSLGWIFAPSDHGPVRIHDSTGSGIPVEAIAERTPRGYALRAEIDLGELIRPPVKVDLAVAINDMAPGRERRRGQLVLVGARDEFIYLAGDRLMPHHYVALAIEP